MNTSPSCFSEVEAIQASGTSITTAPARMISAPIVSRSRRWTLLRPQAKPWVRAWLASSTSAPQLAFVVDPGRRPAQHQQRQRQDDEEEQPRQRRGVAHPEELEGVVVEVEHVDEAGVGRTSLGHHERRGEDLER